MKVISVCIATFNGEKYIREQLVSILSQLSNNDEVVISDDASTDNTCTIIKSLNDERIRLIQNEYSSGVIKNFEKALSAAKGQYIFLSDQDDIWQPNKVALVMGYLARHDLVISDAQVINDQLQVINESYFDLKGSKAGLLNNLLTNNYMGCCMAFNKNILKVALPFPAGIPMHDQWLGIIGELFFTTLFVKDKLVLYRRHNANASATGSKSRFGVFQQFRFRWSIIKYIPLLIARRFFDNSFKID